MLTATRLYLNSPPEAPKNWRQVDPNLNDYHFDPMETCSKFWIPDITEWWHQPEDSNSKYTDLSIVARDTFSIIPHGAAVEGSFSLGREVIGWRQSNTTGKTLPQKVILTLFGRANNRILAGDDPALATTNTENDSEMKWVAEERQLPTMAEVHNILEMWHGSYNLRATQKKSRAQNKQMTVIQYFSDMEEIVEASWSLFQPDSAAAFELTERSPLPPTMSAKNLHGGQTQILNVRRVISIDRHPVRSDDDSAPESISDTTNWLTWNGNLDNPNHTGDNCVADIDSDREQDNGMEEPESAEQQDVSTTPNVPRLIQPTWTSKSQAIQVLVMFNAMEMRRTKGIKKK